VAGSSWIAAASVAGDNVVVSCGAGTGATTTGAVCVDSSEAAWAEFRPGLTRFVPGLESPKPPNTN